MYLFIYLLQAISGEMVGDRGMESDIICMTGGSLQVDGGGGGGGVGIVTDATVALLTSLPASAPVNDTVSVCHSR